MPAPYTLTPTPFQTVLDNNGVSVPGALIYTYEAGGAFTPVLTFADSAGTPNTNPIQADAAGRFVAYLDTGHGYKFVYKTAGGATIRTQDGILGVGGASVQTNDIGAVAGRLTILTAVPVPTADQLAKTSVFWTPYKGNTLPLYDGAQWQILSFAELAINISAFLANTLFDVFGYISTGAVALETVAWTNDTTRATALALQDGVLVKSGDATRRYLGTFRTTGTVGQCEDSFKKRYVWNLYNQKPRPGRVTEATDSWAYSLATIRQANASALNQLDFVIGLDEVLVEVEAVAFAASTDATDSARTGIGFDSTTIFVAGFLGGIAFMQVANRPMMARCSVRHFPGAGRHTYAWLESAGTVGVTTWYGDAGQPNLEQSGIHGTIQG